MAAWDGAQPFGFLYSAWMRRRSVGPGQWTRVGVLGVGGGRFGDVGAGACGCGVVWDGSSRGGAGGRGGPVCGVGEGECVGIVYLLMCEGGGESWKVCGGGGT